MTWIKAELKAQWNNGIYSVQVVEPDGTTTEHANLDDASEYCFARGYESVSSYGKKTFYAVKRERTEDTCGVARIGQGAKLHPAIKYADTQTVQIVCGCPGTSNNHARMTGFWSTLQPTCRRRGV